MDLSLLALLALFLVAHSASSAKCLKPRSQTPFHQSFRLTAKIEQNSTLASFPMERGCGQNRKTMSTVDQRSSMSMSRRENQCRLSINAHRCRCPDGKINVDCRSTLIDVDVQTGKSMSTVDQRSSMSMSRRENRSSNAHRCRCPDAKSNVDCQYPAAKI